VSSPGSTKSCGVAILYKPHLILEDVNGDPSRRLCTVTFSYNSVGLSVASVYGPKRNPDRNSFLEEISAGLSLLNPLFIAGDFNTVFNPDLDRRGGDSNTRHLRESTGKLKELFEACDCVDLWRDVNPDCIFYLEPSGWAILLPD